MSNSNSLYCFWSLLDALANNSKGGFLKPGIGFYIFSSLWHLEGTLSAQIAFFFFQICLLINLDALYVILSEEK